MFAAQLTQEEKLEVGAISGRTFKTYIQAGGGFLMAALVMVVFIINVAASAFSSWWLSHWLHQGSGVSKYMWLKSSLFGHTKHAAHLPKAESLKSPEVLRL